MDMNQYLSMFIDESNDHLQSLNENMLQLEGNPEDLGIVQVIFRSAHTLKGMAATMGFEDLASLTHKMENVLDLVRNEKLKMQDYIFDTMFKSLDALETMVQDITEGGQGKADVSAIVASLQAIENGEMTNGDGPATETNKPANASISSAVELDEFQYSVLDQSIAEGHRVFYVDVLVSEHSQLKGVRAYMVFDMLERSGEVVKAYPSVQDIEQEKFERSFSLYYITTKEAHELEEGIMSISEIESAKLIQLDQETLQQMANQVAATVEAPPAPTAVAEVASPDKNSVPKEEATTVPAKTAAPKQAAAPSRTIRVDIERLDVLMNLFSELLIDRSRLEQLASETGNNDLSDTVAHLSRVSTDLQNIVLKLRMVPVDTVFNRFPRMIRDLAKTLDKKSIW